MKKTLLAGLCLMSGMAIHAQKADVQPTPQQAKEATEMIVLNGSYQLNGLNEANPRAVSVLKAVLGTEQSDKTGFREIGRAHV